MIKSTSIIAALSLVTLGAAHTIKFLSCTVSGTPSYLGGSTGNLQVKKYQFGAEIDWFASYTAPTSSNLIISPTQFYTPTWTWKVQWIPDAGNPNDLPGNGQWGATYNGSSNLTAFVTAPITLFSSGTLTSDVSSDLATPIVATTSWDNPVYNPLAHPQSVQVGPTGWVNDQNSYSGAATFVQENGL